MTPRQLIVALDSQILVWGIRKDHSDPEKVKRAHWLFQELENSEAQIVVPTIALAEYLVPSEPDRHSGIIEALRSRFIFAPFDINCAALSASLINEGLKSRDPSQRGERNALKADAMIVATAKRFGASVFYTNDKRCRALAARVMKARDLPNQGETLWDQ